MFSGVVLVLGRRWWLVFCTASLPPRNSLCQNFTCVFDSVDSPYCARNLRQISLGPTFSLVRNFITTRCAIVIGTPLSRSSWIQLTVVKGDSDGEVRRVPTPHHTSHKVITQSCSSTGCNWQRSVYIWSTLVVIYSFVRPFILYSLLRQAHRLFQNEFSRECDLVLPLSSWKYSDTSANEDNSIRNHIR